MEYELLFECLIEEIPFSLQKHIKLEAKHNIERLFLQNKIMVQSYSLFITCRRLTLIANLKESNSEQTHIKGPKTTAVQEAIDGFRAKMHTAEIYVSEYNGAQHYFAKIESKQINTEDNVKETLVSFLKSFAWSKSMRWDSEKHTCVRPIRSIIALLNENVLSFKYGKIESSNFTFGNRFKSNKKLICNNTHDYLTQLKNNHVMLDEEKRKQHVLSQLETLVKDNNLSYENNSEIIQKMCFISEYPTLFVGNVVELEEKLPDIVTSSIMIKHQSYLPAFKKSDTSKIISNFISVANLVTKRTTLGHERVLKARMLDASLMIKSDLDLFGFDFNRINLKLTQLEIIHWMGAYTDQISDIFLSITEKMYRLEILTNVVGGSILQQNPQSYLRFQQQKNKELLHTLLAIGKLAKYDLLSAMVQEFPNLQGHMMSILISMAKTNYHRLSNLTYKDEIIKAIREQSEPITNNSKCPTDFLSVSLSLADKLDSIFSLVICGAKFSGKSDEFGIRRKALGLLRLILENNIKLDLGLLILTNLTTWCRYIYILDSGTEYTKRQYFDRHTNLLDKKDLSFSAKKLLESLPTQSKINELERQLDEKIPSAARCKILLHRFNYKLKYAKEKLEKKENKGELDLLYMDTLSNIENLNYIKKDDFFCNKHKPTEREIIKSTEKELEELQSMEKEFKKAIEETKKAIETIASGELYKSLMEVNESLIEVDEYFTKYFERTKLQQQINIMKESEKNTRVTIGHANSMCYSLGNNMLIRNKSGIIYDILLIEHSSNNLTFDPHSRTNIAYYELKEQNFEKKHYFTITDETTDIFGESTFSIITKQYQQIIDILTQRFASVLRDKKINKSIINAVIQKITTQSAQVISSRFKLDFLFMRDIAISANNFILSDNAPLVLSTYKRINNILTKSNHKPYEDFELKYKDTITKLDEVEKELRDYYKSITLTITEERERSYISHEEINIYGAISIIKKYLHNIATIDNNKMCKEIIIHKQIELYYDQLERLKNNIKEEPNEFTPKIFTPPINTIEKIKPILEGLSKIINAEGESDIENTLQESHKKYFNSVDKKIDDKKTTELLSLKTELLDLKKFLDETFFNDSQITENTILITEFFEKIFNLYTMINKFMDERRINCDNEEERKLNLNILHEAKLCLDRVICFSEITI